VAHQQRAAGYDAVHLSMLSGLLGNIGYKGEESDAYLGARASSSTRTPART
jgi:hypothetical protein